MLLSGGRQHLESKEIDWVGAGHSLLLTVQIGYPVSPRRGSWRDRCLGLRQLKPSKNLECKKGPRNATQAFTFWINFPIIMLPLVKNYGHIKMQKLCGPNIKFKTFN